MNTGALLQGAAPDTPLLPPVHVATARGREGNNGASSKNTPSAYTQPCSLKECSCVDTGTDQDDPDKVSLKNALLQPSIPLSVVTLFKVVLLSRQVEGPEEPSQCTL